jgi:hypothetical protein
MAIDPQNAGDISALREAIKASRRKLKPFRKNRKETLKQYVGTHYSDSGATYDQPMNLMELAITTYQQQLVGKCPQALVNTPHRKLKPTARDLELALDHLFEHEIDLGETARDGTFDALFSMGIFKVGLNVSATHELQGWDMDPGQVFVETVDLDDWVHDMSVKKWENISYAGDRYRMPTDVLKASNLYDDAVTDKLPRKKDQEIKANDEDSSSLSGESHQDEAKLHDTTAVWDIWLPLEGLVITITDDDGFNNPLRVVKWEGPEHGPYLRLSFNKVPSNTMPLPPMAVLRDLNSLANGMFRKLDRQARRQKTILGVRSGKEKDGRKIIEANDGDTITLDDPKSSQEYKFGGIDQASLAFLVHVLDRFSYMAGNLDTMGGLSPQADTLGQEELLAGGSSQRINRMRNRVQKVLKQICEDVAYYLVNDPLIRLPLVKRVPKTDIEIPIEFTSEMVEGDFLQYNFSIQPHSLRDYSPEEQLNKIAQIFQQYVAPFAQLMAEQGKTIDFHALFDVIGRYANLPELKDILVSQGGQGPMGQPFVPMQQQQGAGAGGGGDVPAKPAQTTRRYERVNRTSGTRRGTERALAQALLGSANEQEAGTIGRSNT